MNLPCGHHDSLLVKSIESDYQYCQLCECQSQLRDALTMERELSAKCKQLESNWELLWQKIHGWFDPKQPTVVFQLVIDAMREIKQYGVLR